MPSDEEDSAYYAKRARDEWSAAQKATSPTAAIAHAKLAKGYEAQSKGRSVDEMIERIAVE